MAPLRLTPGVTTAEVTTAEVTGGDTAATTTARGVLTSPLSLDQTLMLTLSHMVRMSIYI